MDKMVKHFVCNDCGDEIRIFETDNHKFYGGIYGFDENNIPYNLCDELGVHINMHDTIDKVEHELTEFAKEYED